MELWDAYDKEGNLVNVDLSRDRPVPDGLYHMVCSVIVRHADGDYLLMLRDPSKPSYPGVYEPGAGGAALKGESPAQCIRRELFEETGISWNQITIHHLMDFSYPLDDCWVEVYVGRLHETVEVVGDENDLYWSDLNHNFFDSKQYAGEGNLGHILEHIELKKDILLK